MTAPISKFIVDEPPMVVFRTLVRVFGLHEGHLLQHIHYWLHLKAQDPARYKDHFINGRYWVHWTMAELQQQIPFGASSADPYKRVTKSLRQQGVLLVDKHGAAWDQTNWFSIDYTAFGNVITSHLSDTTSTGGPAFDAPVATPPLHRQKSGESSGGQATVDYLITKTTQKRTTTEVEAVEAVAKASRTPDTGVVLDLQGLPENLRPKVHALLAHRADGQRFANLLSVALSRSARLPQERQIQAPILYLKTLLSDPSVVDFTAADALSAQREAAAVETQRSTERAAIEATEAEKRRIAEAMRVEAAERAIESMTHDERQTVVRRANTGQTIRRAVTEVEHSVVAGRLPKHPLARFWVLRALAGSCPAVAIERREPT